MSPRSYTKAIKVLGEERLANFIHAAAADPEPTAARMMAGDLRKGTPLKEIFMDADALPGFPEFRSYRNLKVEQLSVRTFRIALGYSMNGEGRGGEWRVSFRACGRVQRLVPGVYWMT